MICNTGITINQFKENSMQTATSKMTKKYQATIPEPVRKLLNLDAGDTIAFDIDEGIRLRKANPLDLTFTQSLEGTMNEWSSEADEEAYRDL
jgi:antitoxin PrlF